MRIAKWIIFHESNKMQLLVGGVLVGICQVCCAIFVIRGRQVCDNVDHGKAVVTHAHPNGAGTFARLRPAGISKASPLDDASRSDQYGGLNCLCHPIKTPLAGQVRVGGGL